MLRLIDDADFQCHRIRPPHAAITHQLTAPARDGLREENAFGSLRSPSHY